MKSIRKITPYAFAAIITAVAVVIVSMSGVPQLTGMAISAMAEEGRGISLAIYTILICLLIGSFTYISADMISSAQISKYNLKSKYWAGYAIQKIKWSAKRKKQLKEIKVELESGATSDERPQHMFEGITEEIDRLNIKVDKRGREDSKTEDAVEDAKQTPAEKPAEKTESKPVLKPAAEPAPRPAVEPAAKPAAKPAPKPVVRPVTKPATITKQVIKPSAKPTTITKPAARPARPAAIPTARTMAQPARKVVVELIRPKPAAPASAAPTTPSRAAVKTPVPAAKPALQKPVQRPVMRQAPKEEKQEELAIHKDPLAARFGTDDPLKIAEAILKNRSRNDRDE